MGTRSESLGSKKKECNVDGLGLRLRMRESPSISSKRMMFLPRNYYNNHEAVLLSSSSSRGSDSSGSGGGSMFCNTSNQIACMSDIYDVVGAASGSGTNASVLMPKSLNPPNSDSFFPFNSSGEMAASAVNVNVRVQPFTAAQLRELERQTLIYKYLMSSVPVPHELLFPITKNPSSVSPSQPIQGSAELGLLSNNNSDPEPWRCRRTDGKKWRCSRDVAPDQKYCERHSHKSRPRSRKPVELPSHLNNNNNSNNQNVTQSLNPFSNCNTINKSFVRSDLLNQNLASSLPSTGSQQQQRSLDWFMKGETMPVASNSNQERLQMMQSKLESNRKYGEQHRGDLINSNSNSYTNLGGDDLAFQAQWLRDPYSLWVSPKMVSHQSQIQETRHFIDAWSIAGGNMANEDGISSNCFVSPNEKLPISSLTLTMCGGSETFERNENDLMNTLRSMGCSEGENVGTLRPHWMNHVSGMGSPPGGPLAEALCLGISGSAKSDSKVASPHGCSTSTTTSS
ncbi:Growth-regulating factor like [Melia azedarach]|uniref:Growth-regulating factor like n=1 Tax=Melia azedarach TaxID=155640 RepID=A0ACC1XLQ1_MELAZ|nr:Growth-regulating factor like [Melia azedarach]